MKKLLNRSNELINNYENCDEFEEKENCFSCLRNSFFAQENDTYNCLKKLCYYTINYGPAYVNEIYSFLQTSKLLETFDKETLNIYSLESGFSPDFIAIEKYIKTNEVKFDIFAYFGFDIEPSWREITQDATPVLADLTSVPINYNNVDIVFLNKLFSTLKNHNLQEIFLERFKIDLQTLPINSYVVFNDINHQDMGRGEFDNFMTQIGFQVIDRYFFNIDGAYTGNYTSMITNINVCDIPNNLYDRLNNHPFDPKLTPNKTIFFLYRKVN